MNQYGFGSLLTYQNSKTIKGEKLGYRTGILYLAPADQSQVINVCPFASVGCKATCLNTAGRGRFDSVQQARLAKTLFYKQHPQKFFQMLEAEISKSIKSAENANLIPCFRLNGTSDIPKFELRMSEKFPDIQFYSYTKIPKPWKRVKTNYDITFSRSETNEKDWREAIDNGINVAVVFSTKKTEKLPDEYEGYEVIDGDLHDLRFLDKKGVIVGLTAKGRAKADTSGFVVRV